MRILGFIFLSLIISTSLVLLDINLPGSYLTNFINDHFIETFAALVGFNIAAIIFLIGQLMSIEERNGIKKGCINTRKEIKHNSYFLLSAFISSLFLLVIRPDLQDGNISFWGNAFYYIDNIFVLAIFILAIYAIYEILRVVFMLGKNDPA